MSGILDVYDRLSRCYEKPTLRLLTNKWAQVSMAIFTDAFPDPSCGKGTELMHAQVDAYLREFADAGVEVPLRENGARSITGRELCQERWMREDRWLAIYPLDSGETEYRLTADAIEAMEIMDKLSSTAVLLSSPRMDTIMRAIENTALMVNPDYEVGLEQRKKRLAQAQSELDDYVAHGGMGPIGDETVRASTANLMDLLRQVPSDMRRVEEMLVAQGNDLIEEFRSDERPPGQIVGDYIKRGEDIFTSTESGKVFDGAMETLGDAQANSAIADDLKLISNAPQLANASLEARQDIRHAWDPLRAGVEGILGQRRKSSRTIRNALSQHDILKDRELTRDLKDLERLAWDWARASKRNTRGPLEESLTAAATQPIVRQPYESGDHTPPPPLVEHEREGGQIDIGELLRQGGPTTKKVLDAIAQAMPTDADTDIATLFNALDSGLRREVELCGIMQLATDLQVDIEHADTAVYETVALDGSVRRWTAPRIVVDAPFRESLARWRDE